MDALFQSSPLWIKIGVPYGYAVIVALFIICLSDRTLVRLSQIPGCSVNWITFWGLYVFCVGCVTYSSIDHGLGLIIATAGGCLDFTDGSMEKARRKAGLYRSAASKRIGKWLDPLFDKLKYLSMIIWFSTLGIINPWIVAWIVSWDALGTIIRNPINIGVRMWWYSKRMKKGRAQFWMNQIGRRMARGTKAKFFGKAKSTVQSVGLAVCMLYHVHFTTGSSIPNAVYVLAAFLGVLSVLSRIHIHKRFDRVIDNPSLLLEPERV